MADATLLRDLIAAGTPVDLVQRVAMELARASVERETLEKRRGQDRDRQSRRRRLSRDITGSHETSVTPRDVTPGSPLSPLPPDPPNPNPTPGSDADASAEAVASASNGSAELSTSDRVWVEFPTVLADLSKRSEQSVRSWIGKALARYSADDVYRALAAAVEAGTGDPFGYTMRILNPVKQRGPPSNGRDNPFFDFARDPDGGHDERPGPYDRPKLIAGSRH